MNLNQLAKEICRREGKKIEVNIAQVKEILRVIVEMGVEELKGFEDGPMIALNAAIHQKWRKKK